MASDNMRKKYGTIFMGEREASVEQLNAMQEPLLREKLQKERTEDYMERVRARAADRAREILGAAYAERQRVLEEARAEIALEKRNAAQECAKLKAEGETARQMGQAELAKAETIRVEAEKIREAAHQEGYQKGMDEAGRELQEFRGELGQAVGAVLRAIERQRGNILDTWREELADLTQCAVQAGAGFVLRQEHEAILRALVAQALDMLENRAVVTARVNPADEAAVSDMFRAARERAPELKQWIVTGDDSIERGGLIAESGSGSVDLRRENFRAMVDGILTHLALPDRENGQRAANEVRDIVEREVANIAALTPEPDQPEAEEGAEPESGAPADETGALEAPEPETPLETDGEMAAGEEEPGELEEPEAEISGNMENHPASAQPEAGDSTNYAELEEELFPLDGEDSIAAGQKPAPPPPQKPAPSPVPEADPAVLSEGGFL